MKPTMLAVAAALAVAGCGSDDDDGPEGNGTDRAFVAAMIPHHESAVRMAKLAEERAESDFVRELANDIVATQTGEIGTLREQDQELSVAGVPKGSLPVPEDERGMDHDASELRGAKPFDRAFIEMMIPHHEGAIAMAKAELDGGDDPQLEDLAGRIVEAQEREIREMREHLGGSGAAHDGH